MSDKHLAFERAVIALLVFLTTCAIYAQLLTRLSWPSGWMSLLAIAGGMLIGAFSLAAFFGWMESDSPGWEDGPGSD